jgi:cell division protein FtsB
MAARYVEQTRPVWSWIQSEWRRVGTVAALMLTVAVLLHAMFGANGMVVYQQKRAERTAMQNEVERLEKENDQYVERIKALKTDHRAIEREAREQLHYTRPGEYVYVAPDPPAKPAVGRAKSGQ